MRSASFASTCVLLLACSADTPTSSTVEQAATAPTPPEQLQLPTSPVITASSVGYLPASWEVAPNGQLGYSIPLDVPTGRAGMQPKLALTYASNAGNGIVGVGWHLTGTSEIARCGKNLTLEGTVDGVDYEDEAVDQRDRLCLDGQKLVAMKGNYGEPGTEYRTRLESYAKVVQGATGFTVHDRDGTIREYHAVIAPRWAATSESIFGFVSVGDVTERWPIREERDRLGNAVRYNWTSVDDGQRGSQLLLESIEYTRFIDQAGYRRVELAYEDRTDREFAWRSGVRTSLVKRLKTITMYAPNPAATAPVWQYQLGYETSPMSQRSRLGSVQKCGILPSGTLTGCLWAKRFSWYNGMPLQFTATDIYTSPTAITAPRAQQLDVDADGADDLLLERTGEDSLLFTSKPSALGTLWWANVELDHAMPVDVDGDGKSELFVTYVEDGNCGKKLVRWTDNHQFEDVFTWPLVTCLDKQSTMWADLDGDARLELLVGTDSWRVYRNTGNGEFTELETGYPLPSKQKSAYATDFDGDGRAEVFSHEAPDEDGVDTRLAQMTETGEFVGIDMKDTIGDEPRVCSRVPEYLEFRSTRPLVFGDYNGDGLQDVVEFCESGDGKAPLLLLRWNTGNGFTGAVFVDIADTRLTDGSHYAKLRAGDVDRDGRADLVVFTIPPEATQPGVPNPPPSTILVMRSRGDGTFSLTDLNRSAGLWNGGNLEDRFPSSKLGDFNGDGHLDIVRVIETNGQHVVQLLTQTAHYGDRLMSITDGNTLWARETFKYDTKWSDKAEPRMPCAYPLHCVNRGLTVVRSVESRAHIANASPSSNVRTLYYAYEDPVADMRGRGFLGFGKFKIWDPSRPQETIFTFDNRNLIEPGGVWPFAGRPTTLQIAIGLDPLTGKEQEKVITDSRIRVTRATYERALVMTSGALTFDDRPYSWSSLEWEQQAKIDWGKIDPAPSNWTSDHIIGVEQTPWNWLRWRLGYSEYDGFGNERKRYEGTAGGSETEVTTSYYGSDEDAWLVSRPRRRCTTSSGGGATPMTRCETFTIDNSLQLVSVSRDVDEATEPTLGTTTSYAYDAYGMPTDVTRHAGGVSRKIHVGYAPVWPGQPDEHVFPSQVWRDHTPLEHRPSMWLALHPALGKVSAWMDQNGVQGSSRYDALGRIRATLADGQADISYGYTGRTDTYGGQNGIVVTRTQNSVSSSVSSDALGRTILQTSLAFDGTARNQATRYDRLGRVVRRSRPYASVDSYGTYYTYDALDRLLETKLPDGNKTTHAHTFEETATEDANGHDSIARYDIDGRMIESTNLLNGQPVTTTYHYNVLGILDEVKDPEGNIVATTTDRFGRVTRKDDPSIGTYELVYNGFDEIVQKRHLESGDVSTYTRDALGRVYDVIAPEGNTHFTWDTQPYGIGRLAATSSPSGVTTLHHYDSAGRTTGFDQTVAGRTHQTSWSWTSSGRLNDLRYPALDDSSVPGLIVRHSYNAAGYLSELRDVTGVSTSVWKINARNLDDALIWGQFGNSFDVKRTYTPAAGRIETMKVAKGSTTAFDLTYGYNLGGQVSSRIDAVLGTTDSYGYDALARLTDWDVTSANTSTQTDYQYDALGNLDRVLRNGSVIEQNTYGENGASPHALTSHTAANVTTTYTYDSHGRQTSGAGRTFADFGSSDLPRTITTNGVATQLAYSAFGERAHKRTGTVETTYAGRLYERRAAGSRVTHVFRVYTQDGAVAEVIHGTSRTTKYLATDALGTVGATIDPVGTIARQYFDPWGKRTLTGAAPSRLGFTMHEHDDESGLINMHGRLYDPALKRMLSADPHVAAPFFGQSWNAYSYVWNNPTNLTDPTGLDPSGMYYDCSYFTDGCGDGLLDLLGPVGGDPVSAVTNTVEGSVGYGMGQLGWAGAAPGGADYGGVAQSTIDGYAEYGSAPLDGPSAPQVREGPLSKTDPAPCGTSNNPKCGTAEQRSKQRSKLMQQVDQFVKSFADAKLPDRTSMTVWESMQRTDSVEYTAGIIVGADGTLRFTQLFVGSIDGSQVDWSKVTLKEGDRVIGSVHSHPGMNEKHFSKDDVNTARIFNTDEANESGRHPTEVHFYMVWAEPPSKQGGTATRQFMVFDVKGDVISPLP